jgi:hypothetical protein
LSAECCRSLIACSMPLSAPSSPGTCCINLLRGILQSCKHACARAGHSTSAGSSEWLAGKMMALCAPCLTQTCSSGVTECISFQLLFGLRLRLLSCKKACKLCGQLSNFARPASRLANGAAHDHYFNPAAQTHGVLPRFRPVVAMRILTSLVGPQVLAGMPCCSLLPASPRTPAAATGHASFTLFNSCPQRCRHLTMSPFSCCSSSCCCCCCCRHCCFVDC